MSTIKYSIFCQSLEKIYVYNSPLKITHRDFQVNVATVYAQFRSYD